MTKTGLTIRKCVLHACVVRLWSKNSLIQTKNGPDKIEYGVNRCLKGRIMSVFGVVRAFLRSYNPISAEMLPPVSGSVFKLKLKLKLKLNRKNPVNWLGYIDAQKTVPHLCGGQSG
jgi:hypothetical protein